MNVPPNWAAEAVQPDGIRPPRNVKEAAQQFEALLITQLLQAARASGGGWLGTGEESGDAMAAGLAEEQFARALAHSGGVGLSATIAAGLSRHPEEPGGGAISAGLAVQNRRDP